MVVLSEVIIDTEFARLESRRLSRLEIWDWCILCKSGLETGREIGEDPVPEMKAEKSNHDDHARERDPRE